MPVDNGHLMSIQTFFLILILPLTTSEFKPRLWCYRCWAPPGQCKEKAVRCPRAAIGCFSIRYTLTNGHDLEKFGCVKKRSLCTTHCKTGRKEGHVTRCSMSCCFNNYCNRRGLYRYGHFKKLKRETGKCTIPPSEISLTSSSYPCNKDF